MTNKNLGKEIKSYLEDTNFVARMKENPANCWYDRYEDDAAIIAAAIIDPRSLWLSLNEISEEVYKIAAFLNPETIFWIKNASKEVCYYSIFSNAKAVLDISNATEEMYIAAIFKDPNIISIINCPSDKLIGIAYTLLDDEYFLSLLSDIEQIKKTAEEVRQFIDIKTKQLITEYGLDCLLENKLMMQ